ncbi:MAG TPA: hypothetical protein VD860_00935 [Azospirillum sp.]|nr:hypothetical protein [Azospirillum sp.]
MFGRDRARDFTVARSVDRIEAVFEELRAEGVSGVADAGMILIVSPSLLQAEFLDRGSAEDVERPCYVL